MNYFRLDKGNIENIARNLKSHEFSKTACIEAFHGVVERQKISNSWEKYVIKIDERSIRAVVIDTINERVKSIAFYGTFQISFNDLVLIYNEFRRFYSPYDEITQFFFNENSSKGDYVIIYNIDGMVTVDDESWKAMFANNLIFLF